ncbi:MAG: hypothetical protein HS115_11590 [Spirochaetales bacterium]|nr:hypothetical protein [Spirochaetales bacterium]
MIAQNVIEVEVEPVFPWNPQRGDLSTPRFKIPDWAQCMGNSFQNVYVWLSLKYPDIFGAFSTFSTPAGGYAYYSMLEHRLRKRDDAFDSLFHMDVLNDILAEHGILFRARNYTARAEHIAAHIRRYRRPVPFGIAYGDFKHIITGMGAGPACLSVSDPYGNLVGNYRNHNGYRVIYSFELLAGHVTRMILLEDL